MTMRIAQSTSSTVELMKCMESTKGLGFFIAFLLRNVHAIPLNISFVLLINKRNS